MCSPVNVTNEGSSVFKGVVCIDLSSDDMFSDVVRYQRGHQPYGFVMSANLWLMAHPLLSRPLGVDNSPVLLHVSDVEQDPDMFWVDL